MNVRHVLAGDPRRPHHQGDGRTLDIVARDPLTRFSYAHGPLCRWPGLTPDEVRQEVIKELATVVRRVA